MPVCGNCHEHHDTVNQVKACYGLPGTPQPDRIAQATKGAAEVLSPATPKQTAFLRKLAETRLAVDAAGNVADQTIAEVLGDHLDALLATVGKAQASQTIDAWLKQPKAQGEAKPKEATGYAAVAKKGDVHVVDGEFYRIHIAQQSGNAYAAKANILDEAVWEDGKLIRPGRIQWEYMPGMIAKLTEATKTTPEQAAAFGHLVGRCCFCSHAIDTPESTAVGYGPVCASKYGLPWGEAVQLAQ